MSTNLASGIKRFCNHSRRLQTILEETKRCFDDINENGKHESDGALVSVEMLQEEEEEILDAAHKLPGVVIFGQNAYCKSKVVNEIFNRTIFPSFDISDDKTKYRMVRFKHGENLCINLELPDDYSLAENLEAYKGPWNTIPHKDLQISENEDADVANGAAILEVSFNHQLLRYGCTLLVAACNAGFEDMVKQCVNDVSPIIVYAFHTDTLSNQEIQELQQLKEITHFQPICFVKVPVPGQAFQSLPGNPFNTVMMPVSPRNDVNNLHFDDSMRRSLDSEADEGQGRAENNNCDSAMENSKDCRKRNLSESDSVVCMRKRETETPHSSSHRAGKILTTTVPPSLCRAIFSQLCKLGYLTETPGIKNISREVVRDYFEIDSVLVATFDQFISTFTSFSEQSMQRYLVNAVTVLNNTHIRCLNMFIISAFDMARDILITPRKLEFARAKEEELFRSLLQMAVDKGDEIKDMIERTLQESWDALVDKAYNYDFIGVEFGQNGEILTYKGLKICTGQIQELVLGGLNQAVAGRLINSVDILRDSYTGTLTRCLESLEKVDQENPDNQSVTEALKQILNAAYQVEINVRSSSTFINFLLERMKQIIQTTYRLTISMDTSGYEFRKKMRKLVQAMPWNQSPRIDDEWKKKVAAEMLASLSPARLAKSISSQIKDRLNKSHDAFSTALRQLELKHTGRLDKIEEERLKLRKNFAPRVAKVALESTSLKDLILYGMPHMGKEIGRGQYGVVYSCDQWASFTPCAVKSVVPPDDKHWNDLALEFFYTKHVPEHDRVVALRGSVIDYSYGGGTTPAVLLVMDRLQRDLYTAIKQQLDWVSRLQVSIDVVEGIRFLHSQGLVHRDIKLKNVLLDKANRGKITDLGFCKPEAMMSGSIVGTPIHMAPELFTGRYDNSVDVYAFGILFWYICAGSVRLPQAFEQCANKDMLWSHVKKGLRPEQLPVFDDECWDLMSSCWENEPAKRPLLGDVQHSLTSIYERYRNRPGGPTKTARDSPTSKSQGKSLKYKMKR